MDWGSIATVGVGLLTVVNGWMLVVIKANERRHLEHDQRAEALRESDNQLRNELNAINLLVQGQYLTRAEFREGMKQQTELLENLFSRLELKIDRKADRHETRST